jgi:hypothetical protein
MQYLICRRRSAACAVSVHRLIGTASFTTPLHCGQKRTGEFAREWFMFEHEDAGPYRPGTATC